MNNTSKILLHDFDLIINIVYEVCPTIPHPVVCAVKHCYIDNFLTHKPITYFDYFKPLTEFQSVKAQHYCHNYIFTENLAEMHEPISKKIEKAILMRFERDYEFQYFAISNTLFKFLNPEKITFIFQEFNDKKEVVLNTTLTDNFLLNIENLAENKIISEDRFEMTLSVTEDLTKLKVSATKQNLLEYYQKVKELNSNEAWENEYKNNIKFQIITDKISEIIAKK